MTVKRGRPLDPEVTDALLVSTLDALAEGGLPGASADVIAAGARAGKAAIYRRWGSVPDLLADAVSRCTLVPPAPDTGTLRADLLALFDGWTRPLTRCEQAAAALLGHSRGNPLLTETLDQAVAQPLAAALTQIADQHAARSHRLTGDQLRLLVAIAQSLWWHRYLTDDDVSGRDCPAELVDHLLLPLTTTGGTAHD